MYRPVEATAEQLVASTAAAAFASDHAGRIAAWNDAAAELLGHDREGVIGRPCSELLGGLDVFGNRFCGANCPLRRMARRGEPVHEFEMTVRDASSHAVRVLLSSLVLRGRKPEAFYVVHLLRPIRAGEALSTVCRPQAQPPGPGGDPPACPAPRLTSREVEVLGLLQQGVGTHEIASVLCVSSKTVRNHIQNTFRKLGAHNRLEALSVARRHHLL